MTNKRKIPTIIGIIILALGLVSGVLLIENQQLFRLGAEPNINPKDIRISNISDSSLTITWTTDKSVQGFLLWGNSQNSTNKTAFSTTGLENFIHSVTLTSLSPETSYHFKINSGGFEFDNDGIAWQIKTAPTLTSPTESSLIFGTILTSSGTPAKKVLVSVTVSGSSPLSTLTSAEGSWVVPISSARTQDLTSYTPLDQKQSLIEISIQAGPQGIALAQIYPESARPTPDITLGETYNFKAISPQIEGEIPEADVDFPDESTPSSGFDIPAPTINPTATPTIEENQDLSTECSPVKAYSQDWEPLSDNQLQNLEINSQIFFAILCSDEADSLTKAKFSINGELSPDVTTKNDDSELYLSYTVTEANLGSEMTIYAWVYNQALDKWY